MVAVGAGAQERIAEQIQSLGSNLIVIFPGAQTSGGIRWGLGSQQTLTEDDARAIADRRARRRGGRAHRCAASPRRSSATSTGPRSIQGVTPEYLDARDWGVASGRMFEPRGRRRGRARSRCSARRSAQNLFGGTDPLGQTIRIKKVPFTVVGVLEPKGQTAWGQDQDDLILIPLSTAKKKVLGVNQLQPPRRSASITVRGARRRAS